MSIILRLAVIALGLALRYAAMLAFTWWAIGLAGFGTGEHIIATVVWAVIGTVGVRAAMRIAFSIGHVLDAVGI